MTSETHRILAGFIWSICNLLRGRRHRPLARIPRHLHYRCRDWPNRRTFDRKGNDMNNNPYGMANRCYNSKDQDDDKFGEVSSLASGVEKAVSRHIPDLKERVERSFKQWNIIIRDQLRTEMGLRLTVGNEYQTVPVRVVDGLPSSIEKKIESLPPMIWEVICNKGTLDMALKGLNFFYSFASRNYEALINEIPLCSGEVEENLGYSAECLRSIVELVNRYQVLRKILDTDHDTLGAYFFNGSFIHIYWLAIGLVAGGLGVSPEALTIVVATHELAHAYSHIGKDIDSENWVTGAFAEADIHIIEGIAQYYTQIVCNKLRDRMPYAIEAFEKLLEQQSHPYTCHTEWGLPPKSSGEIVRVSMIACRSRTVTAYRQFLDLLSKHLEIKPF